MTAKVTTIGCALCKRNAPLVESHIIPSFVFKWKKETSATGFLRTSQNPQKRVQDGLKLPMLCIDCERLFNGFETPFSKQLFYPYTSAKSEKIPYGAWLLKFCVSVSWRILYYGRQQTGLTGWTHAQQTAAIEALERWSAFLLERVPNPGVFTQHLVPVGGGVKGTTFADLPGNINRYLLRGVELDLPHSETSAYAYAKLPRFLIFGTVVPSLNKWERTKVHVRHGIIQPSKYVLPSELGDYLKERCRKMDQAHDSIPEHQLDKIETHIRSGMTRFVESDQFAAMRQDAQLFGTTAVLRKSGSKK